MEQTLKLEAKGLPSKISKLEFQTLKDTTSTPTTLPYKNTPPPGKYLWLSQKTENRHYAATIRGLTSITFYHDNWFW